jgi:hypothetical protein
MRVISEAYAELKAADPDTALTLFALQTLVKSGKIPSVKVGVKRLVAMETVEAFLRGELNQPESDDDTAHYGKIRKVSL